MSHTMAREMQVLGRTPLFEHCTQRQLRRADRFCTLVNVQPAQTLSHPDEQPSQLVVIIAGRAIAFEASGTLRWLGPGDYFGTLAEGDDLFSESPTVNALTTGSVAAIGRAELPGLLEACPSVASRLSSHHATRRTEGRLERVAAFLVASNAMRCVS